MSTITHRDHIAPAPPQAAPVRQPAVSVIWHWLRQAVPTAVVVAVLMGLAIWGHVTDWTMPKFSSLIGKGEAPGVVWCQEHNVPEAQCIECKKEILPAGKDH